MTIAKIQSKQKELLKKFDNLIKEQYKKELLLFNASTSYLTYYGNVYKKHIENNSNATESQKTTARDSKVIDLKKDKNILRIEVNFIKNQISLLKYELHLLSGESHD